MVGGGINDAPVCLLLVFVNHSVDAITLGFDSGQCWHCDGIWEGYRHRLCPFIVKSFHTLLVLTDLSRTVFRRVKFNFVSSLPSFHFLFIWRTNQLLKIPFRSGQAGCNIVALPKIAAGVIYPVGRVLSPVWSGYGIVVRPKAIVSNVLGLVNIISSILRFSSFETGTNHHDSTTAPPFPNLVPLTGSLGLKFGSSGFELCSKFNIFCWEEYLVSDILETCKRTYVLIWAVFKFNLQNMTPKLHRTVDATKNTNVGSALTAYWSIYIEVCDLKSYKCV